ncbi:serine/threonine protein kinase [Rhizobium phaseoli]|uniref:serine/threonine-protein kinase n=1 Tax=Rhizobium phaseoli TaxID=396 RepID=UPI000F898ABA|nr:serine/threonine-protein kinase [Rhizobium phaseoli]RUM13486.1 serine/threonine protein kinase [Rhizobium phaseoli]
MDGSKDYVSTLTLLGPIGDGAFGEVSRYLDPLHGEVAAKSFFKSKFDSDVAWENACAAALKEGQHLKALEHGHVVKIHHVLRSKGDEEFLLVMEYCEGKSARQVTEKNVVFLSEAKRIICEAAIGLNYIHGHGYLHRDIKPDNILLKGDGHVKVGDFGFVTDDLQFGFATPYGTAVYWAPEVLGEKACSQLSDVYSLGVTFINLLSGDHWFFRQGKNCVIEVDAEGEPRLSSKMLYLPHIPLPWRMLANKLCKPSANDRCPSLGAAVNSITKLPPVEPWTCTVGEDKIAWALTKGKRRVRVEWEGYLGQPGENWRAWSEDLSGNAKRSLKASAKGDKTKAMYSSLQSFFAERAVK